MTDITKCCGENCHLKQSCYRYLAPSDTRQSYANFDIEYHKQLRINNSSICNYYWKHENK